MLDFIGATWVRFCEKHNMMPFNVGKRVGSFFKLNDDRVKLFQDIQRRGYESTICLQKLPGNPFADVDFFQLKGQLWKPKKNKKRPLKSGALGFVKRKAKTYDFQKSLEDEQKLIEQECKEFNNMRKRVR